MKHFFCKRTCITLVDETSSGRGLLRRERSLASLLGALLLLIFLAFDLSVQIILLDSRVQETQRA